MVEQAKQHLKRVLISGFHYALLQAVPFIIWLMHSIIQNLEVK